MQSQHPVSSAQTALKRSLDKRSADESLRTLRVPASGIVDFCSNDYLGFASSIELKELIDVEFNRNNARLNGSTGSRLLAGNSVMAEELEQFIAAYHRAESALLFNSGYDANLGIFSSVAQRNDTILYDELSHASIIDGIRLGYSTFYKFRHNDTDHLEELLKKAKGTIYVAVESVYSMDGDMAPLKELAELCKKYNANLIVDEAHATGVFGKKGEGRVVEMGLEQSVFARLHTYGKALGCHGAVVVGSEILKQYLVNFARPFIYSTALPPHSLACIKCAYTFLEKNTEVIVELKNRIQFFREQIGKIKNIQLISSQSAMQCLLIAGNKQAKQAAGNIQAAGYDVRPILSPTVAVGSERLRICLHTFNTEEQISGLVKAIDLSIASLESLNK
jgi:8-amino-7-oxononanoate synthase